MHAGAAEQHRGTLSRARIDAAAVKTFAEARYVAQVVVLRAPRPRLLAEKVAPPPGLLRVTAVIKGTVPATLTVPLPDPCLAYFQKVGARLIVSARSSREQPVPMLAVTVDSLRRRKLGEWRHLR
ncbi:hypothetical protein FHS95_004127 [Sphingomonas naasensis]|uniref:Uncharacterized protein n=1 Tax=Sphingomonas naasensis TaxID=1344951 RepID=A0A4S1WGC5_9SPHN|nr:hypothetical protein [Sphingomonas naasensis]NIJ22412.1 hypothetical protein [Sphingomonas naasensis]TGX40600.1 hypothetical protein E5A74_13885 [Sphingomonas naasensis]